MVFMRARRRRGCGLVNGMLIAYGRIVPFIATLAMLVAARGLAESISAARTQIVTGPTSSRLLRPATSSASRCWSTSSRWWRSGWVLLNRTTFGRRTFAVGGNPEAARLAGINVQRHTMMLYVLSGLCCGIAAVMIMAPHHHRLSTHGTLYELDAIAAVDHRRHAAHRRPGHDHRLVLGVLIFTTITNVFILNNLSTRGPAVAKGLIIVAAVLLQQRARRAAADT